MQNTQLVTLLFLAAAAVMFMMRVGGSHTQQHFNVKDALIGAGAGSVVPLALGSLATLATGGGTLAAAPFVAGAITAMGPGPLLGGAIGSQL